MNSIDSLFGKVTDGGLIDRDEALFLYDAPIETLCGFADKIRERFCGNKFDICTIINGKSGRCSENCKFCAQSAFSRTGAAEYPLLSADEIVAAAKRDAARGVMRFSIVTSGRRLGGAEVDAACDVIRRIKREADISVCVSFGLLGREDFGKLKLAGASRVHNNLETSRGNFPNVCTTHTFDDKIAAIRAAKDAGLEVCSGGIMGLGETKEDRIDMALTLRKLGIKSVPLNMLNPIAGTPLGGSERLSADDMRRTVAVYRFILPDAFIRLAGGRGLLPDRGEGCFRSGANAAISGDMLTTAGISVETDMKLLEKLGFGAVKQ